MTRIWKTLLSNHSLMDKSRSLILETPMQVTKER